MNEIWQLKIQTVPHLCLQLGVQGRRQCNTKYGILRLFRSPHLLYRAHLIFIPLANTAPEFLPGILPALLGLHFSVHLRWEEEC